MAKSSKPVKTQGGARRAEQKPSFRKLHEGLLKWLKTLREARYRIGATLLVIRDLKLYEDGGHATFYAYLDTLTDASRRTHQRMMELAKKVSLQVALEFDPERLESGLRLLPAKDPTPVTATTLRAIRVPVVRKGKSRSVPFNEATTEELETAVRALEESSRPALPASATSLREKLEKRLGSGPGALGDVGLRRRGKKTVLVLEIPLERGEEFLERWR